MQAIRGVLCLSLVGLALGCSDKPPTGPSRTTPPTVTGLAISGADAVLTGLSASYTATASLSDGTMQTVTPTWTSSDPRVGTVDSAGRLDGRAHGSTTVSATYQGRDASKTVGVVNNYGGDWEGRYVVTLCHGSCGDTSWAAFNISLLVSHDADDLSTVTTTLSLPLFIPPDMKASIRGRVTPDGRLSLAGRSDLTDRNGKVVAINIETWDTTLCDGTAMTGRWAQRRTSERPSYSDYQEAEISWMTKWPWPDGFDPTRGFCR
jgi:hypothetical protein